MQDQEPPAAKFEPFEKVAVTDDRGRRHVGTILWRSLVEYRAFFPAGPDEPPGKWSQWEYAVELPDFGSCPTFEEDRLESTGAFDSREIHRGRRFEISFDTGLEADNRIVEGSYRIPGEFWRVFLVDRDERGETSAGMRYEFRSWPSGIEGVVFHVPAEDVVDRNYVLRAFASAFGTGEWVEVRGPDSRLLK